VGSLECHDVLTSDDHWALLGCCPVTRPRRPVMCCGHSVMYVRVPASDRSPQNSAQALTRVHALSRDGKVGTHKLRSPRASRSRISRSGPTQRCSSQHSTEAPSLNHTRKVALTPCSTAPNTGTGRQSDPTNHSPGLTRPIVVVQPAPPGRSKRASYGCAFPKAHAVRQDTASRCLPLLGTPS